VGDRVVLGIGNPDRGDDAIGLLVLDELRTRCGPDIDLSSGDGDPGWMIDAWEGRRVSVVVDAVHTGAAPGSVTVIDASAAPLPATTRLSSSHAMGVASSVELARALGRLPDRLVVVGVEGRSFAFGSEMSPEVAAAVKPATVTVLEVLADA
jgi:hydrogenase maturation protease